MTDMDPKALYQTYMTLKDRHADRLGRIENIDSILRGEWNLKDPAGQALDQANPNYVLTALEDTADAASVVPTIRVAPSKNTKAAKEIASKMERIGTSYFDENEMELLTPLLIQDYLRTGMFCLSVWPDEDMDSVQILRRDPALCFPEPSLHPTVNPKRCIIARDVHISQLPHEYQTILRENGWKPEGATAYDVGQDRWKMTLIEYFTPHEIYIGGFFITTLGASKVHTPVIFECVENKLGRSPIVVVTRQTWDTEPRGQYDQVIDTLLAFARLQAMVIDYADQSVYSDVWVKDLIGEMPWGGGGFIELGPNGAIGRVPPAVTSMNVDRDLERLTDQLHVHSRWPKSRPGQVDQAIASGKFVEATVGMMNTLIKSIHQNLSRAFARTLDMCFAVDQAYCQKEKTISGTYENSHYLCEYNPKRDIDLSAKVRVEYGLGLGRDPSQSAVLMLGYNERHLVSDEFVMENIDGLTDVEREKRRLDTQELRKMLLAQMLQRLEQGMVPPETLPSIIEERERGEDLVELYKKYIAPPPEPEGQAEAASLPGGPPGQPGGGGLPGMPPGMPGMPPGAPGGEAPPMPPPPPEIQGMLGQLSSPAGPGGVIKQRFGG